MAGNRLDGPLGNIGPLPPPISAIGVDRYGVRDNHLRDGLEILDLVGPCPVANRVHGGAAGSHVRKVGADIAERFDLHSEDSAVMRNAASINSVCARP